MSDLKAKATGPVPAGSDIDMDGEVLPPYAESELSVTASPLYKEYSFASSQHCEACVSISAPVLEDTENVRSPIALSIVMDRSGSMRHAFEMVKKTLEFLVTQLRDGDYLSLTTFESSVVREFSMMEMNKKNKKKVLEKLNRLQVAGMTALAGGMVDGLGAFMDTDIIGKAREKAIATALKADMKQTGENAHKSFVTAMYVFTDGAANVGMDRTQPICRALKSITQSTKFFEAVGQTVQISTFGFGKGHNEDMLRAIADDNDGSYYYIESEDHIPDAFARSLGCLVSTCVENLTIECKTVHGKATFDKFLCSYPTEGNTVRIGTLQSEEEKDIGISFQLAPLNEPQDQVVCEIHYSFFDVRGSQFVEGKTSLVAARTRCDDTQRAVDTKVDAVIKRFQVGLTLETAMAMADNGRMDDARITLEQQIKKLDGTESAEIKYLSEEIMDAQRSMQSRSVYRENGKKRMQARNQMIQQQRYNQCSTLSQEDDELDIQAQAFYSKGKAQAAYKSKAKGFFSSFRAEE